MWKLVNSGNSLKVNIFGKGNIVEVELQTKERTCMASTDAPNRFVTDKNDLVTCRDVRFSSA